MGTNGQDEQHKAEILKQAQAFAAQHLRSSAAEFDKKEEIPRDVINRLVEDLRERKRLSGDRPEDNELALMIIDEYIQFPPPAPGP